MELTDPGRVLPVERQIEAEALAHLGEALRIAETLEHQAHHFAGIKRMIRNTMTLTRPRI